MKLSLRTLLFPITLTSLFGSFLTTFSQNNCFFVWPYTKVLHDVSCVFKNNEPIKKPGACVYSSFCEQRVGVNDSPGPEANIQRTIQGKRLREWKVHHLRSQYFTMQGSSSNRALGQHHCPKRGLEGKTVKWLLIGALKRGSHCTGRRL